MKRLPLAALALAVVLATLTGCHGPQRMTRALDEWANNGYEQSPWLFGNFLSHVLLAGASALTWTVDSVYRESTTSGWTTRRRSATGRARRTPSRRRLPINARGGSGKGDHSHEDQLEAALQPPEAPEHRGQGPVAPRGAGRDDDAQEVVRDVAADVGDGPEGRGGQRLGPQEEAPQRGLRLTKDH